MRQMLIIGGVILVLCGIGFVWLDHEWHKDHGVVIGMAAGNPQEGELELHIVVSMGMVTADIVPAGGRGGALLWDQWISDHFSLRDAAGKNVTFAREGHSTLISDQKAFNPEFFLRARVKAGQTYTLDYTPVAGEPRRCRNTFTVPPEGLPFQRAQFDPVKRK